MIQATLSFEIELTLSGAVEPGRPDKWPSASDDVGEQGYGPEVVDLDIEDIGVIESERNADGIFNWKTVSLMDGIDMKAPEIQKLISNILALKGREAEEALLSEESE